MRTSLIDGPRFAGDSVDSLLRAAEQRYRTAEILNEQRRRLAALYLFGYSAEMCLCSAYFRSTGFTARQPIDRDTRRRRMAEARLRKTATGEPLMNSDPHPIVGWARFLQWQRSADPRLSQEKIGRLQEAVNKSSIIYAHWRPELRYKTVEITPEQIRRTRTATSWLLTHCEHL
jgi:hypothetical protein